MKKILLWILILLLIWFNNGFSAWYWKHAKAKTHWDWATWCNTDWDTTWWSPTFSKSPLSWYYTYDSRVNWSKNYDYMRCEYRDWSRPESLSVTYNIWWTNHTETITVKAKDRGGSKLKKIVLQESKDWWSWSTVKTWDNLNSQNTIITRTWNRTPVDNSNFKYKIRVYDYAWNYNYKINNWLIKFDITNPSESEITPNPAYWSYFVANDNKTILYTTSSSGSPITEINTTLEKYNDKNSSNSLKFDTSNNFKKYNNDLSIVNISQNDITSWNYRPYTFHLWNVCDEAGNCTDFNKNYYYNVYANDVDFPWNSSISSTDNLSNWTKLADWTINNVKLILKDKYNNKILKVTKADNTVIRNVDVNVNYNNALYLDQYKQSWDSAVYIWTTNLNWTDTPNSWIFRNDSDWIYNLEFKVYSPTTNSYNKAKWNFKINNITAGVSDFGWNKTFVSNIEFKFKPIYKLNFKNEWAKRYWFIEWAIQWWWIDIVSEITSSIISEEKIYLEFGKSEWWNNNENLDYNLQNNSIVISEWHRNDYFTLSSTWFLSQDINTLLIEENNWVVDYNGAYLASFVKYKTNWKTIVYPADIIWKNVYFGNDIVLSTYFKWIKILWKTYSKYAKNIFQNQELDYNALKWNITKWELKKKIRKKAYNIINNINVDYYTNTDNNYKELLDNKIIYYKLNWWTIKYSDIDQNYKAKDWKTILIIWWDLIIEKNDINTNIWIHWIIVLKGLNWKWWNILVDDDVLNINAIIYADKALLAYDVTQDKYLTLDDWIWYFKNQLYIKWSLFSNNTIGWARWDNKICPYYTKDNCDIKKAQKFDLNYLRRYYRYDSDLDWDIDINDDVANWGSSSVWLENSLTYFNYPLVIKYNPFIQITPPPLFNN